MDAQLRRLLDSLVAITDLDLDLESVLRRLLEAAKAVTGARSGALGLLSPDARTVVRFLHSGLDEETAAALQRLPHGDGVVGRLLADPRPLRLHDPAGDDPDLALLPVDPRARGFLGVPLVISGVVFGDLYLFDDDEGGFSADDEDVAVALAAVAGAAISSTRRHADARRLAVYEDRDRIAHDLHDHVIQRLFAAGLSLQALAARLDRPTDDLVRTRLDSVVSQLDDTVRDVRTTIFELHTSGGEGGLRRQLLDVVTETARGVATSVRTSGPVDTVVTGTLAADVLAVTREAVSNAVRHGGAGVLVVTVEARDDIVVQVDDDGHGFQQAAARSGLAGLEQRAERRGGSLVVERRNDGGTRLRWSAPLAG